MTNHPVKKSVRTRLARSELLLFLAVEAEEWRRAVENRHPSYKPFEEWSNEPDEEDSLAKLARVYDLTGADLGKILGGLGDELERRAMRAGYDEAWVE